MKIPRTKRAMALAVLGGLAVVAVPVLAAADVIPVPPGNPAAITYTGCLRTSGPMAGQVFAVRQGDTPLRACLSTEKPIKVSGGDITSVAAGTGLTITPGTASDGLVPIGLHGDVGLQLAANYRLPQNCAPGQVPAKSTPSGWTCAADQYGPIVHGHSDRGGDIGDTTSTIGSLDLPPGSWAITASVTASSDQEESHSVHCQLDRSLLFDGSQTLDRASSGDYDAQWAATELTLIGVASDVQPFHVAVLCSDTGRHFQWSDLDIMAVGGSSVTVVNL